MDFESLPMELLEEILAYLCFESLKAASLVCRRWYQASEKLIIRYGQLLITDAAAKRLDEIRNFERSYQALHYIVNDWSNLQVITADCIRRFPKIQNLQLDRYFIEDIYKFYDTYRFWVEQCESFKVMLAMNQSSSPIAKPENYELSFPNLKTLQWQGTSYERSQRSVTINAPNLESVCIDAMLNWSVDVRIPSCDRIKFIRCWLRQEPIYSMLVGNIFNVETLIMYIDDGNFSKRFLLSMQQLRYLKLQLKNAINILQYVQMMQCDNLKVLSITNEVPDTGRGTLYMATIFNCFRNLETLELGGIDLIVNGAIQETRLKFLKLYDVSCPSKVFSMNLPQLEVLSVPENILCKLKLDECKQLKELYVVLESSNSKETLKRTVIPFVEGHNNLKKLSISSSKHQTSSIEDNVDFKDLGLEHLELRYLDVSIVFLQTLVKWELLKRLTLAKCSINCLSAPFITTHLPSVQRMTLDHVEVMNTSGTDFPLMIGEVCEIHYEKKHGSTLLCSTHQPENRNRRISLFTSGRIDPMAF